MQVDPLFRKMFLVVRPVRPDPVRSQNGQMAETGDTFYIVHFWMITLEALSWLSF